MAETAKPANEMNQAWKDLTQTSVGLAKQFGIVERGLSKLKVAFAASAAGTLFYAGKALTSMIRNMSRMYEDVTEAANAHKNLTIAQSLGAATLFKYNGVLALGEVIHRNYASTIDQSNKGMQRTKMLMIRLSTYFFFTVTALAALVVAFLGLDAALNGSDAALFNINTRFETLNASLAGLGTLITGEGGASGLAMLGGALIAAGLTAAVFGATLGGIVLALGVLRAIFLTVQEATGSFELGMMAAIGTGAAMVGTLVTMKGKFAALAPIMNFVQVNIINSINAIAAKIFGASKIVQASRLAFVGGVAALAAGIYGMVEFATGAMEGWKAAFLGVFSAILIGVGLFLVGVAAIPAAIIAAVVLAVATVYRFRDDIWDALTGIPDAIGMAFAPLATIANVAFLGFKNTFIDPAREAVGGFIDTIDGIMTALSNLTFANVINFFIEAVNALIGTINNIPGVNMDQIELMGSAEPRAMGGPVTGGKPYIVGEEGPELFTPNASGNITPNDAMGGGSQSITLNINVGGVTDRTDKRALAREIGDMLTQELRRTGGAPTRGRF